MAIPTNREEFKKAVLRRLGAPLIEINIDEEQLDDRIDEAIKYYADYHFDGSEVVYYKHIITDEDMANKYITMPDNIMGAVSIFDIGSSLTAGGIFNIQYQIALNDLYTLTSQSILPYYMAMQNVRLLQEILVGKQPIRFNRHSHKLYIDMNWNKVNVGEYLIVQAYQVMDPDIYQDMWHDRWLMRYAEALVGVQWASNLQKFVGVSLPGGVQFNADAIMQRYTKMQDDLEEEMLSAYSVPPDDYVG